MTNLKQKFSKVLQTTSVRKFTDQIPFDLLIDIFSRVPAKSIARFRCVSKLWESILRRSDFCELYLTNALSRPRLLLFTLKVNEEVFFFTSPQPQNPHDNSSLIATRYHKCLPKYFPSDNSPPLCGLVLLHKYRRKLRVVCNPVTRESITLPKLKEKLYVKCYFGYDPINKQFKVLCMTLLDYKGNTNYSVLTLEDGKRYWRRIECKRKFFIYNGSEICIKGVLYFRTLFDRSCGISCFDIRFEKFTFVNMDDQMFVENICSRLFNYKGKLMVHQYENRGELLVLWVLEDAEKHKWSKLRICVLPPLLAHDMIALKNSTVGMTETDEIVFSPQSLSNPFYVSYYNTERNTLTRVNIQGFEEFKQHSGITVHTYLDYVENMKFM